jgi:hypothetical protein
MHIQGLEIALLIWNEHAPGRRGKDQQILSPCYMHSPMLAMRMASREFFEYSFSSTISKVTVP